MDTEHPRGKTTNNNVTDNLNKFTLQFPMQILTNCHLFHCTISMRDYFNGLVQDCSNCIDKALGLLQYTYGGYYQVKSIVGSQNNAKRLLNIRYCPNKMLMSANPT